MSARSCAAPLDRPDPTVCTTGGPRRRRWARAALLLLPAVVGCGGESPPAASNAVAPPAVVVTEVVQRAVPVYFEHVGQTVARETVEIRARVEGFLQRIAFQEGTLVDRGQVLFVIDRRPLEEALRQAEAQLAQDQAALARARDDVEIARARAEVEQAEAALQKARESQDLQQAQAQLNADEATRERVRRDAVRARELFAKQLIAAAELDAAVAADKEADAAVAASRARVASARVNQQNAIADAEAALTSARARVTQTEVAQRSAIAQATAAVEGDRAAIAQARLNLGYATIRSPLAGLIGRANVHVGSFVGRGEPTLLAVVSRIDPIDVAFSVTERQYLEATRDMAGGKPSLEGVRRTIPASLLLSDGSRYAHEGRVNFVDRAVNPETNTLLVRARFPNPDGLLRPGGNVQVRVQLGERPNALLVPQRAVQQDQAGTSVFVVRDDGTVEARPVQTGPRYGSWWLVEQGLAGGESVIVEGLQKVRPGIKVAATRAAPEAPAASPGAVARPGS
jgi:RND family efflux transporter MFP subunit